MVIELINRLNKEMKCNVAKLADLQGPKLRIGEVKDGSVLLKDKQILTFVTHKCIGDENMVYMSYERFPLDVHQLGPEARDFLHKLADYLVADTSVRRVEINGHADDQGTHSYNQKLSERRARSVFDFLAASGVNGALMQRRAFGESKPRMAGRTKRARAANRRAEIRLLR